MHDVTDAGALLAAGRCELEHALTAAERQLDGIRAARGVSDADDEHDPEGPTLSSEWSRAEGIRADIARELDELDAAQERLANGTYGLCEDCGTAVPAMRLNIRPATRWCVDCAAHRGH